jgi:hypothetical protein
MASECLEELLAVLCGDNNADINGTRRPETTVDANAALSRIYASRRDVRRRRETRGLTLSR